MTVESNAPRSPVSAATRTGTRLGSFALRAGLLVAGSVFGMGIAELGARAYFAWQGAAYSSADTVRQIGEIELAMAPVREPEPEQDETAREARSKAAFKRQLYHIHPFTGYDTDYGMRVASDAVRLTQGPDADEYLDVFVLGGSVATIFCDKRTGGLGELVPMLERLPLAAGRPVRTHRLALPGFKQPQQLVQLSVLIARGARPDLVINLDGLNEVRASHQNVERGLEPTWPSAGHWSYVTRGPSLDEATLTPLLEMRVARERVRGLAEDALGLGLHRSAILGRFLLSRLRADRACWEAAQARFVGASMENEESGRSSRFGIPFEGPYPVQKSVDLWESSSMQMHALCELAGAQYVHVLQPTLHDVGSKPISLEERRTGFDKRGLHPAVSDGYPLLRAGLARLQRRGVSVMDATGVFGDYPGTLYTDPAHFNATGNSMLAQAIGSELGTLLAR